MTTKPKTLKEFKETLRFIKWSESALKQTDKGIEYQTECRLKISYQKVVQKEVSELGYCEEKQRSKKIIHIPKKTKLALHTNNLESIVCEYVNNFYEKAFIKKNKAMGVWRPDLGRMLQSNKKGEADTKGTVNGRSVEIEMKASYGDKQRDTQIENQSRLEAAGGVYFVLDCYNVWAYFDQSDDAVMAYIVDTIDEHLLKFAKKKDLKNI